LKEKLTGARQRFPQRPNQTMRFSFASAVALLAIGSVQALDKPLDIEVTKAVECERKTKAGE